MRSTIIPAQITTVEDKIAGSFSLSQILILMVPVFTTAIIYILLLPIMKLVAYKLILILISVTTCSILAIRIKGKIVVQWLGILVAFRLRPKYYLYNKNDPSFRNIDLPRVIKHKNAIKAKAQKPSSTQELDINLSQLIKLEKLTSSGKVALHYQFSKK